MAVHIARKGITKEEVILVGGGLLGIGAAAVVLMGKSSAPPSPPPGKCGLIEGYLYVAPPSPVYLYKSGQLHPFEGGAAPNQCGYPGTINTVPASALTNCPVGSPISCTNPWPYALLGCSASVSPTTAVVGSYIALQGYANWSPTPPPSALAKGPYNWLVYRSGNPYTFYYQSGFISSTDAGWSSGNATPGTYIAVFGVRDPYGNNVLCIGKASINLVSPKIG